MTVLESIRNKQRNRDNDVSVKPDLRGALAKLGLSDFRDGQEEAVQEVVTGNKGVLVVFPTGFGKSVVYQVPSLVTDKLVVVVSPLIALMKDQVDKLQGMGVNAIFINSTVPLNDAKVAMLEASTGGVRMLYIAPERFDNEQFVKALAGINVDVFAIDEAHCISRWGHDFRPAYSRLGGAVEMVKPRQVVALTATATKKVQDDICSVLGIPEAKRFVRGVFRPNLRLNVLPNVGKYGRPAYVAEVARSSAAAGGKTGIVYTVTKAEAEELTEYLCKNRIHALCYHAGLTDKLRSQIQEEWSSNGGIVVATCAFGMGIDRPDVRFVIHAGLSSSVEDWYQAIGRAGRDGKESHCIALYDAGDYQTQMTLIDLTNPCTNDVVKFWGWVSAKAKKEAAPGKTEAEINMTQKDMGLRAGCGNVGGCVAFLRQCGRMKTLGRGKYWVDFGDSGKLDTTQAELVRKEKIARLDEVVRFYRTKECRMAFICGYFGDGTFPGKCGVCDNC